jgi:hypothetical protein
VSWDQTAASFERALLSAVPPEATPLGESPARADAITGR